MEPHIQRLVAKAEELRAKLPKTERLVIGVAGIPGSGKTTLAKRVAQRLCHDKYCTTAVSMDGYHLSRAALAKFPNAEEAIARRGAAFTFNADRFLDLIIDLKQPLNGRTIVAPSFDHKRKDPIEGDMVMIDRDEIVIVEGNYVALDEDLWRDARTLMDEVWFVDVDENIARTRLAARHLRSGIVKTIEDGDKRAVENDLVNGREILEKRLPVDEIIKSTEDATWVHQ